MVRIARGEGEIYPSLRECACVKNILKLHFFILRDHIG